MLSNYDSTKLSFDYISLNSVAKEIVYPKEYFSNKLCVANFAISTMFYVLHSLAYDKV